MYRALTNRKVKGKRGVVTKDAIFHSSPMKVPTLAFAGVVGTTIFLDIQNALSPHRIKRHNAVVLQNPTCATVLTRLWVV